MFKKKKEYYTICNFEKLLKLQKCALIFTFVSIAASNPGPPFGPCTPLCPMRPTEVKLHEHSSKKHDRYKCKHVEIIR